MLAFFPVDQRKLDLVLHVGDSFWDDDVIAVTDQAADGLEENGGLLGELRLQFLDVGSVVPSHADDLGGPHMNPPLTVNSGFFSFSDTSFSLTVLP